MPMKSPETSRAQSCGVMTTNVAHAKFHIEVTYFNKNLVDVNDTCTDVPLAHCFSGAKTGRSQKASLPFEENTEKPCEVRASDCFLSKN